MCAGEATRQPTQGVVIIRSARVANQLHLCWPTTHNLTFLYSAPCSTLLVWVANESPKSRFEIEARTCAPHCKTPTEYVHPARPTSFPPPPFSPDASPVSWQLRRHHRKRLFWSTPHTVHSPGTVPSTTGSRLQHVSHKYVHDRWSATYISPALIPYRCACDEIEAECACLFDGLPLRYTNPRKKICHLRCVAHVSVRLCATTVTSVDDAVRHA